MLNEVRKTLISTYQSSNYVARKEDKEESIRTERLPRPFLTIEGPSVQYQQRDISQGKKQQSDERHLPLCLKP